MIKVEHTKTHLIPNDDVLDFDKVLVTDAKLVLVRAEKNEPFGRNWIHVNRYNHYPILISETEKIEVGDWVYNAVVPWFNPYQIKDKEQLELVEIALKSGPRGIFKVLALPEHFSPKHLQAIVDGKLKDGDKVLIECEKNIRHNKVWWCEEHKPVKYQNLSNVIPTLIYQEGDSTGLHYKVHISLPTGEMKVDLSEIEIEENNQMIIKLNPHITIYPVEEKMYTREEWKEIVYKARRDVYISLLGFDYEDENKTCFRQELHRKQSNQWFEQNVG